MDELNQYLSFHIGPSQSQWNASHIITSWALLWSSIMRPYIILTFLFAFVNPGTLYAQISRTKGIPSQPTKSTPSKTGLFALGLQVQAGIGASQTFAGAPTIIQLQKRIALAYNTSNRFSYRIGLRKQTYTHKNTPSPNDIESIGHAELTVSPGIIFHTPLHPQWTLDLGFALALGAMLKYQLETRAKEDSERHFAIPITSEVSLGLRWQWKKWLSLKLETDYRPVFFREGDMEQVLSHSLSLGLDF